MRPLEIADPTEIGGHRLIGRLGSGGMGVVYLGKDRHGDFVAIKAAHDQTSDDELRHRFRGEATCARRVPSAYTARLLADGTDQTPPYIITEYIEGRSLEHIVQNDGPLPPEQLRALATGVARALAAIHHAGLIHRDLKPANVLLTPTGPRVIDFGIAQKIPAYGGVTGAGMVMGSPGWISPERLTRSPATPAADIFCWGCLIAYAGTGRHPFGEGDPDEIARRIIHEPPDLDGLGASFRQRVEATLAKDPAERPSARELLACFSPEDPVVADREPRRGRHTRRPSAEQRRVRRVTALTIGSAAAAMAATLTAVSALHHDRTVGREPDTAAAPPTRAAAPRPTVPEQRGSARGDAPPVSAPRMPPAPHRPAPAGQSPEKATAHNGEQDTGTGASRQPVGTAARTVDRATTAAPATTIDDLLNP